MAGPVLSPIAAAPPPPAPLRPALPAPGGPRERAVDTLARTLWGEARFEPVRGIEAVASVVLNRVTLAAEQGGWWWGDSVLAVCRAPGQFPCWSAGEADPSGLLPVGADEPVFGTCLRVARRALAGVLPDATGGATRYHAASDHPAWSAGELPTAEIGSRLFYRILA